MSLLWSVTVVLAGGVFPVELVAGQFVDLGGQIFHFRVGNQAGCHLTGVIHQGLGRPVRMRMLDPP